jgi:hypothetical protein
MNSKINRAIDEQLVIVDKLLLTINRKTDEFKNNKSKTYSKNKYDEVFDGAMSSKSNISDIIEHYDECLTKMEQLKEKYEMAERDLEEFIRLNNNAYLERNSLQSVAKKTIKDHGIVPSKPEEIMALQPEQSYPTGGPTGGRKKTTRKTRRKKRKSNK